MIGLGVLVVEHFDALEADFARFYGADLPGLLWGPEPVTYRRLSVLVRGIPAESALGISTGALRPGWGATEELLATVVELVDAGNRSFFRVHSKRGAQQPKPIKVTRPADPNEPPKRRRKATSEDLVAMFGGAARYTGPPRGPDNPVTSSTNAELELEELLEAPVPDPPVDRP